MAKDCPNCKLINDNDTNKCDCGYNFVTGRLENKQIQAAKSKDSAESNRWRCDMKCYVHPEKEAIGTCVGCGKAICDNCKMEVEGKYYCKNCIVDLAKKSQANPFKNLNIQSFVEKNKLSIILGSILLMLILSLMYFHIVDTNNGGTILIPKEHMSFNNTFIDLNKWLKDYNEANFYSKTNYSYLDDQFKKRGLIFTTCPLCNGTGKNSYDGGTCYLCKGSGRMK